MGRTALCAVLLACARAASAQPAFTPELATIIATGTVQDVSASPGLFRMYFVQDGFRVRSATSTDLATWGVESSGGGIRLSTGSTLGDPDFSSITALGVLPSTAAGNPLRMFYVGISSDGLYSVLSATSTDGLAWSKEAGIRLRVSGGLGFLDSPRPIYTSATSMRLYYVADSAGRNNAANYRVFSASSVDNGLTLSLEGQRLNAQAFQVAVTTLTDGRTRLYYSQPLAPATTATQALSAISANGTTFADEAGARLSTTAANASLTYPVVVRGSSETYRWRMFHCLTPAGSSTPYVTSAVTLAPTPASVAPNIVLNSQTSAAVTVAGEIFSPAALAQAVRFQQGAAVMPWAAVTRVNDLAITGTVNPSGVGTGLWDVTVTNSDGRSQTKANALIVDIAPGSVSVLDNLLRPAQGGVATITVTTFENARVTLRLFTATGGFVATIIDADLPKGQNVFTWNGRTAGGTMVASGLYLLRATGPKLDTTQKIVVIK